VIINMRRDPIISEVRKAREAYAKRFGYDLDRIFADLRTSEKTRGGPKTSIKRSTTRPESGSRSRVSKRRKAA
jgi:hypothetical protein